MDATLDGAACTTLAHMVYFSSRLTFAWSNVISFELYSGFR